MTASLVPKSLHLVNTTKSLQDFISQVTPSQFLSIDTEFHSENRYHPKLMLLQIADMEQNTWVIDPLHIDISPLHDLLKEKTLNIHGGKEDIRILQSRLFLHPTDIFDTQIAAAFLGFHYPTRLDQIISHCLGITTPQQQTLSNWSQRPLSESQIQYAAEDASALIPLFVFFQEKLKERKKLLWRICREFAEDILQPKPHMEWRSWGVSKTLPEKGLHVLSQLLIWREKIAEQKNKPANYILPRNVAIDIARRLPSSLHQLKQNRRIHTQLIKNFGKELLRCVQLGCAQTSTLSPITTAQIQLKHLLKAWSIGAAHRFGIDAALLLPEDIATEVALHGCIALKGWRKEILYSEIEDFLLGKTGVFLQDNTPVLHRR